MTAAMENDPVLLVHAYLDGELDPAHAMEIERRLAADPALLAERDRIEALQRVIAEKLPKVTLPPGLARRIEAAIGGTPASGFSWRPSAHRASSGAPSHASSSLGPSWRALAASVMISAILASGATWFVLGPGLVGPGLVGSSPHGSRSPDAVTDMVVASHMRALMAPQPTDVGSSDRHTVKPWFNGRVTEAPRVIDLGSEGFPLVGGRIDVIGRLPVPTLVYRRRQHLISLIAVPEGQAGQAAAARRSIAGYNVLTWTQNGTVYWAVSDVAVADLETFAKAFREAGG
jgi:anti-sigma factor RsiW